MLGILYDDDILFDVSVNTKPKFAIFGGEKEDDLQSQNMSLNLRL